MKQMFTASVWQEGDWYVAQCLDVDVASQGETEQEALDNLREALELYFEPPVSTRAPQTRTIEVEIDAA
jgi:predicted RNase H-like HicB family nuclease